METRRCGYCHTLLRADQMVCRHCGRQLPLKRTVQSQNQSMGIPSQKTPRAIPLHPDAPSMPQASLHRAGHTFGLHPEDQPYQSSLLSVQRLSSKDTWQRRRMQMEPEGILFPPTSERPALRKARRDAVEHIHASKQNMYKHKGISLPPLPIRRLQIHFPIRWPRMGLSSRTISVFVSLSCIFFLLAVSIIAFALIGKRATQAANVRLNMSPDVLRTHDTFTLTGQGFAPQLLLSFYVDGPHVFPGEDGKPLQIQTNHQGTFTLQGRIPDNWSVGVHILRAESSGGYVEASLRVTILAPSIVSPVLKLAQSDSLFSGGAPGIVSSQNIVLTNAGGGTVSWQASSDSPWLSVTPAQGTFSGQQSVQVTVNRGSLSARSYVGHLLFLQQDQDTPQQMLTVQMAVTPVPAALAISTTSLTYEASTNLNPADQSITLRNTGDQSLNWSGTVSSGSSTTWLKMTPSRGQLDADSSVTVAVSVDAQQLPAGSYQGTITFAGGASATVNVGLTVVATGQLVVSPSEMHFTSPVGKIPDEQRITLQNSGGAVLNWTSDTSTKDGSPWLQTIGHSGSLNPGSQTTLGVQVDSTKLLPGSYQGTLTVSSENSTMTIAVSLTVTAPMLSMQPATMNFVTNQGTDPANQQITLANSGNAPATWQLSSDQPFVTLSSSTSGTLLPGQQATVSVHVSTAGLSPKTYSATITCIDSGSTQANQKVTVNIDIRAVTPPAVVTVTSTAQP